MQASAAQAPCTAIGRGASAAPGVAPGRYIAVTGGAIVRMQSAVVADNLPAR